MTGTTGTKLTDGLKRAPKGTKVDWRMQNALK